MQLVVGTLKLQLRGGKKIIIWLVYLTPGFNLKFKFSGANQDQYVRLFDFRFSTSWTHSNLFLGEYI